MCWLRVTYHLPQLGIVLQQTRAFSNTMCGCNKTSVCSVPSLLSALHAADPSAACCLTGTNRPTPGGCSGSAGRTAAWPDTAHCFLHLHLLALHQEAACSVLRRTCVTPCIINTLDQVALSCKLLLTPLLAVLQVMAPIGPQQEAAAAVQVGSQPGLVPHAHCVSHLHLFALQ
jgi:hypothetical protein